MKLLQSISSTSPSFVSARSGRPARRNPRRRAMAADILVVAVWAATIPGLMWLGAAGGF